MRRSSMSWRLYLRQRLFELIVNEFVVVKEDETDTIAQKRWNKD